MAFRARCFLFLLLFILFSGNGHAAKTLRIFNFAGYISPSTVPSFVKSTGINVDYQIHKENSELEKMLTEGGHGFDVVVLPPSLLKTAIELGLLRPIDKGKIPNLSKVDPRLLADLRSADKDNKFAVPYFSGVVTLGVNYEKVNKALDGKWPSNHWDLVFNPEIVSKLSQCGVSILDSPTVILPIAFRQAGRNSKNPTEADYAAILPNLLKSRKAIVRISNDDAGELLLNGQICVAVSFGGELIDAKQRALQTKDGPKVSVLIPDTGMALWIDSLVVLKGSANPDAAFNFINFLLADETSIANTTETNYAPANWAVRGQLDRWFQESRPIYPSPEDRRKGFLLPAFDSKALKAAEQTWRRFKDGNVK